jgi:glycosyltransferase involved in cell wall biosynthesis
MRIVVCYLGKRGGGAELTLKVVEGLEQTIDNLDLLLILSKKNELLEKIAMNRYQTFLISGNSIKKIFSICLNLLSASLKIRSYAKKQKVIIIFPMASPLDLIINFLIRGKNTQILRVIHDASKHPGDIWPGKKSILWMCKRADKLVVLSEFVKKQLPDSFQSKTILTTHPVFNPVVKAGQEGLNVETPYVLFIGRIRKYKGLDLLFGAWRELEGRSLHTLIVAGEGKIPEPIPRNTVILNRWLELAEIEDLILGAEVVVFPYIEASQSGLIPMVKKFGKKLIISNNGGLLEQVVDYPFKYVLKDVSTQELTKTLESAIQDKVTAFKNTYTLDEDEWFNPIAAEIITKH